MQYLDYFTMLMAMIGTVGVMCLSLREATLLMRAKLPHCEDIKSIGLILGCDSLRADRQRPGTRKAASLANFSA